MRVNIYNNITNELLCSASGAREAAKFVASHEGVENIYTIEKMILECLQLNKPLIEKYYFKIED